MKRLLAAALSVALAGAGLLAQQGPGVQRGRPGQGRSPEFPPPTITDYKPRSTLKVAEHKVPRARFPVIDIHSHQPTPMSPDQQAEVAAGMDANNIRLLVNLSGGSGEQLREGLAAIAASPQKDRIVLFANVNFEGVGTKGWTERAAAQLDSNIKAGARGLKIFKAERDRMFRRHPKTTFIAAHFGYRANDLAKAQEMLDTMPNVRLEVAAILAGLGRQPRAAHDFFVKNQDRVLFGKDSFQADEYPYYWRTFETGDEYFDYYRDYHAFWKLYGMALPDQVLKKLYYRNALKLVPGLPAAVFPD